MKQMKKTYLYILFGIMVLVQIAIPAQAVYTYETAISYGTTYKFKTAPVDPNDPFRGKYITLDFEMDSYETPFTEWEYGSKAYAYITKDENEYAVLDHLSQIQEQSDLDYIVVKVLSHYDGLVHFELPFDRYYMEETKAYDAELLYRKMNRDQKNNTTYALVTIKDDSSVLIDVIINEVSIKDAVEK